MVSPFLRSEEEFIRHLLAVQELVYTLIHAQSGDVDLMLVEDCESLEKFDARAWDVHPGFLGSIKSVVVENLKVKRSRATGLSFEAKMAIRTYEILAVLAAKELAISELQGQQSHKDRSVSIDSCRNVFVKSCSQVFNFWEMKLGSGIRDTEGADFVKWRNEARDKFEQLLAGAIGQTDETLDTKPVDDLCEHLLKGTWEAYRFKHDCWVPLEKDEDPDCHDAFTSDREAISSELESLRSGNGTTPASDPNGTLMQLRELTIERLSVIQTAPNDSQASGTRALTIRSRTATT
jgi:hypothetical protein